MSLSDRRTFLLTLPALLVAGCKFTPVYKTGGAAKGLVGQIRFNLIESREGFALLEALEARLGRPGANPYYDAQIDLEFVETSKLINPTAEIARIELRVIAKIKVTDNRTRAIVFSDDIRETTGYTTTPETGARTASALSARDRVVKALADSVVLRLTSTAESWAI